MSIEAKEVVQHAFKSIISISDIISYLRQSVNLLTEIVLAEKALSSIPLIVIGDKEQHRALGMAEGVASYIVELLKKHIISKNLCCMALVAVKTLCRHGTDRTTICEENILQLEKAGACEAVIEAIRTNYNSEQVVVDGCWALRNLAPDCTDSTLRLRESGACEVIGNDFI